MPPPILVVDQPRLGDAVTPATIERSAPASVVGIATIGTSPDSGTVIVPVSANSVATLCRAIARREDADDFRDVEAAAAAAEADEHVGVVHSQPLAAVDRRRESFCRRRLVEDAGQPITQPRPDRLDHVGRAPDGRAADDQRPLETLSLEFALEVVDAAGSEPDGGGFVLESEGRIAVARVGCGHEHSYGTGS